MPIKVDCPQCGRSLKAPDRLAGKKAMCPDCRTAIMVPQFPPRAPIGPPEPAGAAPDLSAALEEESREEEPQALPSPERRPSQRLPLILGGVAVLAIIVLAVVLLLGRREKPAPAPVAPPRPAFDPFAYVVPSNADTVFDADVAALRKAKLWETLRPADAPPSADAFAAFVDSMMPKPVDDPEALRRNEKLKTLLGQVQRVHGGLVSDDASWLLGVSASAAVDYEGLLELARQEADAEIQEQEISAYKVYASDFAAPGGVLVARVDDRFAIVGSDALVRAALAAMRASQTPTPPADLLALAKGPLGTTVALATKARPKEGLPFAPTPTPPQGDSPGAPQPDPMESYQSATCMITVAGGLAADTRITFANPDEAAQLKQTIDGLVAMFAMMMMQKPELARTLQTLKTQVEAGVVKVNLTITPEQAAALVKMLKESPPGAPASRPDAMTPPAP